MQNQPSPGGIARVINEAYLSMTDGDSEGRDTGSVWVRVALEKLVALRRELGNERGNAAVVETISNVEPDARVLLAAQAVVELDLLGYEVEYEDGDED